MSHALWRKIPARIRFFCMRHLFGIADHYAKIGRVALHNRLLLSARYIAGSGIEIGGLGRPLRVGSHARVKYVDRLSGDDLRNEYPESEVNIKVLNPDIVANGETLDPIPDSSQSFVIANHVIEHFENPILFFKNAHRVLKVGGILFLAIPDKEKTFDHRRPITDFQHLKDDFNNGPEGSRWGHFVEYATLTAPETDDKGAEHHEAAARKLMQDDYSIHFHVWDIDAMFDMISAVRHEFHIHFRIRCSLSSADECVFILEKMPE